MEKNERSKVPFLDVFTKNTKALVLGTLATVATFLVFYIMTVFTLSWATSALHYSKISFLIGQMGSMIFFAIGIPLSAVLADRYGRNNMLVVATILILLFGLFFSQLFVAGNLTQTYIFLCLGLFLMGLTYGPIGTTLAEIFPPSVRYTGSSLGFNLAGILGASLTPLIAIKLATKYGLAYVGYYIALVAIVSLIALLLARTSMKSNKQG